MRLFFMICYAYLNLGPLGFRPKTSDAAGVWASAKKSTIQYKRLKFQIKISRRRKKIVQNPLKKKMYSSSKRQICKDSVQFQIGQKLGHLQRAFQIRQREQSKTHVFTFLKNMKLHCCAASKTVKYCKKIPKIKKTNILKLYCTKCFESRITKT